MTRTIMILTIMSGLRHARRTTYRSSRQFSNLLKHISSPLLFQPGTRRLSRSLPIEERRRYPPLIIIFYDRIPS